ncbi:hypothetical protein Vi05172_g3620 [Venturia inaequalis]|uniref:Uncharacterized protein n=1 Tax=Venturia inaequalis TaxID=5025 RepID=A0A8H3Z2T8_VENIN|nr:hypothetical protein EG327_006345 [Venturia inaequalis]RDI86527.1 hypothetical protein Vi05172_g3620 [Venturia inaequalis]
MERTDNQKRIDKRCLYLHNILMSCRKKRRSAEIEVTRQSLPPNFFTLPAEIRQKILRWTIDIDVPDPRSIGHLVKTGYWWRCSIDLGVWETKLMDVAFPTRFRQLWCEDVEYVCVKWREALDEIREEVRKGHQGERDSGDVVVGTLMSRELQSWREKA